MTTEALDRDLNKLVEIDRKLVLFCAPIKVLSSLGWPLKAQQDFLKLYRNGKAKIPEATYPQFQASQIIKNLDQLIAQIDADHPVGAYLAETAHSYRLAALMLENLGTKKMTDYSIQIYGKPADVCSGNTVTSMDAARHFINIAEEFHMQFDFSGADKTLTAEQVKRELQKRAKKFFGERAPAIVVDKAMTAKAAAGGKRIRLRRGSHFSPLDVNQLWQHEALVHSLTAINGQEQPYLKTLAMGSPRTTATQEGLATFAELVTGVMDLNRLKRIALRIIAVDMGLKGADFMDVFKFFLEAGQPEEDAFQSTVRVFRGGVPTGGAVFTKDSVYLHGLLATHTFFRWAMHESKLEYGYHILAGRFTYDDLSRLEPYFESGLIAPARFLPPWLRNIRGLAAYLAFSLFVNKINMQAHIASKRDSR